MTLLERLGGRERIRDGVVETFRRLSRYPHPSWQESKTGLALARWLEELGAVTEMDPAGNLRADLPATAGRENSPGLVIQGHLDMVCAVAPGSGYVPERDPVQIRVENGFLCSDGRSSLGADNMLGNAAVLWLLSERKAAHGPLRLLFTVAEEVGLEGAKRVDPGWLSGMNYLLNTDGFHLHRAIVGSACGRRETYTRPLETEPAPEGMTAWRVSLTGGTGGHSGYDIHRGRINAGKVLALLLEQLTAAVPFRLASWQAGTAHNAIPAQGSAVVVLPPGQVPALRRIWEELKIRVEQRHRNTDPALRLELSAVPVPERVWTEDCRNGAVRLVGGLFSGVAAMHPAFPDKVGDSANLGAVDVDSGLIRVRAFLRCHDEEAEQRLAAGRQELGLSAGFDQKLARYPAWPGRADNPLALLLKRVFREQTGGELEISAVHVGLEPSILRAGAPGLTMVSIGPDILDAHSVDERAPVETLPDFVLLAGGFLEALGT